MIIIDKKRRKVTVVKHPRAFVLVHALLMVAGLYILFDVAMAETFGTYGFIGLIAIYYGFNRLNKVSGHIISSFRRRR